MIHPLIYYYDRRQKHTIIQKQGIKCRYLIKRKTSIQCVILTDETEMKRLGSLKFKRYLKAGRGNFIYEVQLFTHLTRYRHRSGIQILSRSVKFSNYLRSVATNRRTFYWFRLIDRLTRNESACTNSHSGEPIFKGENLWGAPRRSLIAINLFRVVMDPDSQESSGDRKRPDIDPE